MAAPFRHSRRLRERCEPGVDQIYVEPSMWIFIVAEDFQRSLVLFMRRVGQGLVIR